MTALRSAPTTAAHLVKLSLSFYSLESSWLGMKPADIDVPTPPPIAGLHSLSSGGRRGRCDREEEDSVKSSVCSETEEPAVKMFIFSQCFCLLLTCHPVLVISHCLPFLSSPLYHSHLTAKYCTGRFRHRHLLPNPSFPSTTSVFFNYLCFY